MVTEVSHFTIVVLLYDIIRGCMGGEVQRTTGCMWLEISLVPSSHPSVCHL